MRQRCGGLAKNPGGGSDARPAMAPAAAAPIILATPIDRLLPARLRTLASRPHTHRAYDCTLRDLLRAQKLTALKDLAPYWLETLASPQVRSAAALTLARPGVGHGPFRVHGRLQDKYFLSLLK